MNLIVLSWKNIIKIIVYFIFLHIHALFIYYYYFSLFYFENCGDMFVPK